MRAPSLSRGAKMDYRRIEKSFLRIPPPICGIGMTGPGTNPQFVKKLESNPSSVSIAALVKVKEMTMLKHTAVFAVAGILSLGFLGFDVPSKPASTAGSWQVDTRHSDVKLITDATTDYGKTKINVALGYARIYGRVKVDDGDPAKSSIEFRFYPATSMDPPIDEDGKSVV